MRDPFDPYGARLAAMTHVAEYVSQCGDSGGGGGGGACSPHLHFGQRAPQAGHQPSEIITSPGFRRGLRVSSVASVILILLVSFPRRQNDIGRLVDCKSLGMGEL